MTSLKDFVLKTNGQTFEKDGMTAVLNESLLISPISVEFSSSQSHLTSCEEIARLL